MEGGELIEGSISENTVCFYILLIRPLGRTTVKYAQGSRIGSREVHMVFCRTVEKMSHWPEYFQSTCILFSKFVSYIPHFASIRARVLRIFFQNWMKFQNFSTYSYKCKKATKFGIHFFDNTMTLIYRMKKLPPQHVGCLMIHVA